MPARWVLTGQLWGTQSMTGKQWTKVVTNGGLNARELQDLRHRSWSTTSVVLSLTGKSLLVLIQQHQVNGLKSWLQTLCSREGRTRWFEHHRRRPWLHDGWSHWASWAPGFPGMKILQFAFNPDDESIDSPLGTKQTLLCTQEHTITTLFLDGTAMKLTIQLVSTWLVIPTVKNTNLYRMRCFVPSLLQSALWPLLLCKIFRVGWLSSDELPIYSWWKLVMADDRGSIDSSCRARNCLISYYHLSSLKIKTWKKEVKKAKNNLSPI